MHLGLTKRRSLVILLGLGVALAVPAYGRWREASNRGGQHPAEPFRIAGNFYYVGANDATAFLLTGPEGHVLINGGYPGTPPLIIESIATLGFDIADVEILLVGEPHLDHAGGMTALQKASGAELWVSERDADVVGRGGAGAPLLGPFSFVTYLPFFRYPAPRVDRRFRDGDTVGLGAIQLTAHLTAGHTPGYPRVRRGLPLLRADDPWVMYRRGPFAMMALSEYVGEAQVNTALRRMIETSRSRRRAPPLQTTLDLYRELRAVTPDSLQSLLRDLFEINTIWELDTRQAVAEQTEAGTWPVTLEVEARKETVDTAGVETRLPMNDLVEIGIFAPLKQGQIERRLLHRQKHRIRSGRQTITVTVTEKPEYAGIDPYGLLDWEEGDNMERVEEKDR